MEAEVSGAAWWAFGLGLASVFTCGLLGILGPFAIWLGVGANRRGGGPVAVAGIVFGILGTLILIVWLLVFALVGYFDVRPPTHTLLPSPETCGRDRDDAGRRGTGHRPTTAQSPRPFRRGTREAPFALAGEAIPGAHLPIPVIRDIAGSPAAEGLASADAVVARCCFLLGQIGDHSVLDALAARLDDSDRTVREFTSMALARMGDRRGLHASTAALSGNRWWVRFWAVEAIGRTPWSYTLAPMLRDPDDLVRALAEEVSEQTWHPFRAAVAYAGPEDAPRRGHALHYLVGETDWWWHAVTIRRSSADRTCIWLGPTWSGGSANAAYLFSGAQAQYRLWPTLRKQCSSTLMAGALS